MRTRSRACGRALGAAGTALPAPRRHRDLFLCRDTPSPPLALPGWGIQGFAPFQGRDVTRAAMSPGPGHGWAPVGSDAPHRGARMAQPGARTAPRTPDGTTGPGRHHRPRSTVTRKGLVTGAHPGEGEPRGTAPRHRPGSPTSGWHRAGGAQNLPSPPGQPKWGVPAVPPSSVPPVGAGDGGSSTTKRFECKRDPYPAPGQASCSRLPGEIRDGRAGARRCHRGGGQGCGRPRAGDGHRGLGDTQPSPRQGPGVPFAAAPAGLGPLGTFLLRSLPAGPWCRGAHTGAGQEMRLEGEQAETNRDNWGRPLNQGRATAPLPQSRRGMAQSYPGQGLEVFFGGNHSPRAPPSTSSQSVGCCSGLLGCLGRVPALGVQ